MQESDEPSVKSAGGFILTLSILLALLVTTGLAQLPFGLSPGWVESQAANLSVVWPQGWSFFASELDTGSVLVYVGPAGADPGANLTESHASAADDWGFGETASAQALQINELIAATPAGSWRSCRSAAPLSCAQGTAATPVTNGFTDPTLCGPLVLARVRLAPPGRAPVVESIAVLQVGCP